MGLDFSSRGAIEPVTRRSLVVRAGKKFQLAQTKRNRSRKSLARTNGFRLRMRTTNGRAVLKRRRADGFSAVNLTLVAENVLELISILLL